MNKILSATSVPVRPALGARRLLVLAGLLCGLAVAWAQGLEFSEALLRWMDREYGRDARERVVDLQHLIGRYASADEDRKLDEVNDFFNAVRYSSDNELWGEKDYWATPYEVLGINSADCEDYALSKYFTLISMGVDEAKLRITYVKAVRLNEAHMVLAYYPSAGGEPMILDNLTDRISSASDRTDLVPVYSFNGTALWLAANRAEGKKVGSSARISLWQDFQAKLARQMGGN